jgi:hypothetical protein
MTSSFKSLLADWFGGEMLIVWMIVLCGLVMTTLMWMPVPQSPYAPGAYQVHKAEVRR